MVRIAGYGRMSTDKQQMSPAVQERAIVEWVKYQQSTGRWPDGAEYVGMFVDEGVTSKIDLLDREAGQHLVSTLDPGDIIVVAKYNRAFRSAADAERTLERCGEAGLKFVFLDLNIDTSTANGKMMAGVLAAVSKHERDLRSETTKESLEHRARRGLPTTMPPVGWSINTYHTRNGKEKRLVVDKQQRLIAQAAARLIETGSSRSEMWRKMRPFYKKHGLKQPLCEQTLVSYAAASKIGFPRITVTRTSRLLGFNIATIGFVKRTDHAEVRGHLRQIMKEKGYEHGPEA